MKIPLADRKAIFSIFFFLSQEYCLFLTALVCFLKIFKSSLLVHGPFTAVEQIWMILVYFFNPYGSFTRKKRRNIKKKDIRINWHFLKGRDYHCNSKQVSTTDPNLCFSWAERKTSGKPYYNSLKYESHEDLRAQFIFCLSKCTWWFCMLLLLMF